MPSLFLQEAEHCVWNITFNHQANKKQANGYSNQTHVPLCPFLSIIMYLKEQKALLELKKYIAAVYKERKESYK